MVYHALSSSLFMLVATSYFIIPNHAQLHPTLPSTSPTPTSALAPSPSHQHHHTPHHPHHPRHHHAHSPSLAPAPSPAYNTCSPPPAKPVVPPPTPAANPPTYTTLPPIMPPIQKPLNPSTEPPVKPPTKPRTYQPVEPPRSPPAPYIPPLMKRKFVAVQGVVYCKNNCSYSGIDTLFGASPLAGATLEMRCRNTKYLLRETATTDKNGYFFMQAPPKITTYGSHKCKVYLAQNQKSVGQCTHATDLNGGTSGASLFLNKWAPPQHFSTFSLFSVGPFAFESKQCFKHSERDHLSL